MSQTTTSAGRSICVAGAQIPTQRDVAKNEECVCRAIDRAAQREADVLVTPEGSLSGYVHDFDARAVEAALDRVVRYASERSVALALGTCFQESDGGRYNEIRFFDREGRFLGFHAKKLLCKQVAQPDQTAELDLFKSAELRSFEVGGVPVGGLICNDMWANPEYTPMDDPHLLLKLSRMGTRVVFHAVNSGQVDGDEWQLCYNYHEANLRLRARSARQWVVIADACDPHGRTPSRAPSGVVDPSGNWVARVDARGEQHFAYRIPLPND